MTPPTPSSPVGYTVIWCPPSCLTQAAHMQAVKGHLTELGCTLAHTYAEHKHHGHACGPPFTGSSSIQRRCQVQVGDVGFYRRWHDKPVRLTNEICNTDALTDKQNASLAVNKHKSNVRIHPIRSIYNVPVCEPYMLAQHPDHTHQ